MTNGSVVEDRLEREPPPQSLQPDIGPPPDGGREAWLCILGTFFHLFCVFGFTTSAGQLFYYYSTHQLSTYSKGQISWIGAIMPLCVFSPSVFMGRIFDVYGARPGSWGGTVVIFIATMGLAFSKEYYQFFLGHMCFGIGGCLVYSPSTAVAAHWFLRRRSTAVGIIVGGSGLGGVIYPIMIEQLLRTLSFRDALIIVACFNLALMIPACFWMKARLPPRSPPPWNHLKRPWRSTRYVFLCVGCATYGFNLLAPYFNAPALAMSQTPSVTLRSYAVAILQAGSFVGRVGAGILADKLGVWNVFGSLAFLTSITFFAFWVPTSMGAGPAVIGLVVFGALSGGWFTLAAAATAAISPVEEVGMRIGMMWSGIALSMFVGPVVVGQLLDAAGGKWKYAGIWCGCTAMAAGFLTIGPPLLKYVRSWGRRTTKSSDVSFLETGPGQSESEELAGDEKSVPVYRETVS